MLIIPAIDLMDGRCVRLKQGARATRKVYADDPAAVAAQWGAGTDPPEGALAFADPRLPALGSRIVLPGVPEEPGDT